MLKLVLFLILFPSISYANDFKHLNFEFGRVIFNEKEEAIDFKSTNDIPISNDGKSVMYGIIVTSENDEVFTLDSLHTIPTRDNKTTKMIGKTVNVRNKAAIFLKTQHTDIPGRYTMEIFIDGLLAKTISYELSPVKHTGS